MNDTTNNPTQTALLDTSSAPAFMNDVTEPLAALPLAPSLLGGEAPKPTMLDKAILLTVEMRGIGRTRKASSESVQADADKDLVRVSKLLLDAPELQRLDSYDTQIRAYIAAKCLPSTIRKGVYFLPLASLVEVENKMREFAQGREALVDEFVAVYPCRIEQAQMRLREFFDPRDYPSPGEVKALFSLFWQYVAFGVPDALAEINRDLFDRERAKAQDQWREAQEAIQDLLRARLAAMVSHLRERLTPGEDGKSKTFKNNTIDKLSGFLTEFEALNVTDDAQLANVVAQARELLTGVDAETLRKSKNIRDAVKSGFDGVQTALDALVINKPSRGISFEDE